jgi:YfiR/HmsC-like
MAFLRAVAHALANRRLKNQLEGWLIVFVVLLSSGLRLSAQTTASPEYQVKAVFLFNFAQFVDWPPKAFADAQSPLIIGVLGDDPFGTYLDETVRGEKANGRPLVVQRYRRVGELKTCHVLFISRSESDHLDQILGSLRGRNILTVGESEDFALRGGMIQFIKEKNKIRMRINLEAVKAANLKISSKLLRVAETKP